ncbi:hypothetical protein QBC45DRAFT_291391, partial [Copromyces sp. CBS 386.78]
LLIERVLQANRTEESISVYREKATQGTNKHLTREGDLILYNSRLIVPDIE